MNEEYKESVVFYSTSRKSDKSNKNLEIIETLGTTIMRNEEILDMEIFS